ncbi:MAG: hypothetical protein U0586_15705 [Candidatus Brocadiaceae bacterium]
MMERLLRSARNDPRRQTTRRLKSSLQTLAMTKCYLPTKSIVNVIARAFSEAISPLSQENWLRISCAMVIQRASVLLSINFLFFLRVFQNA